jgi:hypothetical protein
MVLDRRRARAAPYRVETFSILCPSYGEDVPLVLETLESNAALSDVGMVVSRFANSSLNPIAWPETADPSGRSLIKKPDIDMRGTYVSETRQRSALLRVGWGAQP